VCTLPVLIFFTLAFQLTTMFQFEATAQVTTARPAKLATEHNWSTTPSDNLAQAGNKIVHLQSCPAGVNGREPEYWLLIDGPGSKRAADAEPVKVTGGTCAGDGQPGTLEFATAKAHAAGCTISSTSSGLQEAVIAARFAPTNPPGTSQSGNVSVPPGEYKAFARVSIRASNITVDFSGSIIECWMDDVCIFAGDPKSAILFQDITLISPRGRPGTTANCSANPVAAARSSGSVTLAHGEATVKGFSPSFKTAESFNVPRATRPRRSSSQRSGRLQ
jgi:hypothetical protein